MSLWGLPSSFISRFRMPGSLPNRDCQNEWLMTTTGSAAG
jgi:hypothetical protein